MSNGSIQGQEQTGIFSENKKKRMKEFRICFGGMDLFERQIGSKFFISIKGNPSIRLT